MQLPYTMRDSIVEDLDEYLEAVSASPDTEAIVGYVIELLESYSEEEGVDDVVAQLEEEAGLDGTLAETLEEEMNSNDEFEFTGEEIVSLLERMCDIEWESDEDEDEDEEGEDEEDEEEEEDDDFF